MSKKEQIGTAFLYVVFFCYILFLLKLLFFSRGSFSDLSNGQRTLDRSMNLIPFHSIKEYIFNGSDTARSFAFGNVAGNIAIFVPLGAYLSFFKNHTKCITLMMVILMISLLVETIQGLFGIGAADIDDIILNCAGGLTGVLGYELLLFIYKDEKKVRAAIMILSGIGLPVLLYLLLVMRLRF